MVAIATLILTVYAVVSFTRGVFLNPILGELGWNRGTLSGAFSVFVLLSGPLAVLTGRLTDRYGPRFLVAAGGLCAGAGLLLMSRITSLWQVYAIWIVLMGVADCSVMTPTLATIPKWFTTRRGIALGIATTGFALGGMLWPPVTQSLISALNWRTTYLGLGMITAAAIIILAQFMKHSPQRAGLKPYGETVANDGRVLPAEVPGLSFAQAFRTGRFWLFGLLLFGFFFFFQVIIVHLIPHATDIGISPLVATTILALVSGVGIASRLSMGFIADRVGCRRALVGSLAFQTLALGWLLVAREAWALYLFAVIFGIGQGGIMPLQMMVTAELFGLKALGMLGGAVMMLGYAGMAVGPIVAGGIFDATGSYQTAFLICVILGVAATAISLLLLRAGTVK